MADLWRIYNESEIPADPPVTTPAYYVKKGGNDSLDGLSDATAWATLAKGVSVLAPGDTLYVRGGTYLLTSQLSISRSGTAAAPITIAGYPGETAIISGDTNSNGIPEATDAPGSRYSPLVQVTGNYVVLDGLEQCFSGGRGVTLSGSHSEMKNCHVHDNYGKGIHVLGVYNSVHDCHVHHVSWINSDGSGTLNYSNGIECGESSSGNTTSNGSYAEVYNNVVHSCWGEGIISCHGDYFHFYDNVVYDCWACNIDVDQASHGIIERNLVYWTGDASFYRSSGAPGIMLSNEFIVAGMPIAHSNIVRNNIVVHTSKGVVFWKGQNEANALIDTAIYGNTLVNNIVSGIEIQQGLFGTIPHSGNRIFDNLITQSGGTIGTTNTTVGVTFDHNQWSRTPATIVQGAGDVVGAPLLVDANHAVTADAVLAGYYKLTASSPARGVGIANAGLTEDYFGTARSDPPDMGAHEY